MCTFITKKIITKDELFTKKEMVALCKSMGNSIYHRAFIKGYEEDYSLRKFMEQRIAYAAEKSLLSDKQCKRALVKISNASDEQLKKSFINIVEYWGGFNLFFGRKDKVYRYDNFEPLYGYLKIDDWKKVLFDDAIGEFIDDEIEEFIVKDEVA